MCSPIRLAVHNHNCVVVDLSVHVNNKPIRTLNANRTVNTNICDRGATASTAAPSLSLSLRLPRQV